MRFPNLETDSWQLRSGEAVNASHPKTFWIPLRADRESLCVGQGVKLVFDIEATDESGASTVDTERMWVIVTEVCEGYYMGVLENEPASIEVTDEVYLCRGAEIPFRPEHVVDIQDPPHDYAEEQVSRRAARTWPRG